MVIGALADFRRGWDDETMGLFKRRKYSPPLIGSALDPYHYPEDETGNPAPSPNPLREPDLTIGANSSDDSEQSADDDDDDRSDAEVA